MALLDLALITQSLIDLINTHVTNSAAWSAANILTVSPLPPDRLTGDNTVGLYLYHVTEETTGKNTYIPGVSDMPVRYNPLSLNLYYVLTAHSDIDNGGASALREQLMMGLAMKALHEFPLVNDDTAINGALIMHPQLRGSENAFRVSMLPVKVDDAVSYWMAGSNAQRLAAYFHVAVIKIEPEEARERAGRVLTYNIFVQPSDAPRIDSTANVISFTPPNATEAHPMELRPAQVTYDDGFAVIGSSFSGNGVFLQIRRADWDAPVSVDAAWNVAVSGSRITATARAVASGSAILPGIYAASVRVERWRNTPSGTRVLTSSSNDSPFVVVPRITAISAPNAQGRFTVTGSIFQNVDLPADQVHLFVGDTALVAGNALNLQPGEFAVTNATTLAVRLPAGLTPGIAISFRVIIRGAESAPQWVVP